MDNTIRINKRQKSFRRLDRPTRNNSVATTATYTSGEGDSESFDFENGEDSLERAGGNLNFQESFGDDDYENLKYIPEEPEFSKRFSSTIDEFAQNDDSEHMLPNSSSCPEIQPQKFPSPPQNHSPEISQFDPNQPEFKLPLKKNLPASHSLPQNLKITSGGLNNTKSDELLPSEFRESKPGRQHYLYTRDEEASVSSNYESAPSSISVPQRTYSSVPHSPVSSVSSNEAFFPDVEKFYSPNKVSQNISSSGFCSTGVATCLVVMTCVFPPFGILVVSGFLDRSVGVVPKSQKWVCGSVAVVMICLVLVGLCVGFGYGLTRA